jgi:hypothetical protein
VKYEGIRFLEELGDQFAHAESAGTRRRPGRRVIPGRWRALAVAGAALALAGGAVAAVVGTDDGADTTGLFGAKDRVTVAEGTTRGGSDWLLSTGSTAADPLADGAPKNFCVSLRVTGQRGPEASIYCGPAVTPGKFSGGQAEDPGRDSGLVFGTTPDSVASVSVIEKGSTTEYPTIDDPADMPGRFFVADAGGDYRETKIVFQDATGRPLHEPAPITRYMRRVSVLD